MPGVHGLTAVLALMGLVALGMAIGFLLARAARREKAPADPPEGPPVSSEEKFRGVLEGSAAAVFVIDDGRVRYANQAAGALTGAAPAALVDRAFLDRFHPDSHEIVRHRVLKAPSPAVAGLRYEARLTGTDDRWVELTGRAVDFGGVSAALVTAFDVTERRRAEEAMRESERRMRDILETVQLVAVLLDREGIITYCNPYFLELVGYEEEDVIGREWFSAFVPEEDRESGRATLRDRLQLGAVAAHNETAIVTRHGDRRVIGWSNTVLRDWTGEVSGTASIGADVTDRRRAEEQLQHDAFHDALTGLPNRALFIDPCRRRWRASRAPCRAATTRACSRWCSWTSTASSSSTTASATAWATACSWS